MYDLQALVNISAFTPLLMTRESWLAIDRGINFIQPYFLGQKQHIEFLHTTVQFDIDRKNAGMINYQNNPWDPQQARSLLRLARPIFPDIQAWTDQIVDVKYDPRIKLLAGIYGENFAELLQ